MTKFQGLAQFTWKSFAAIAVSGFVFGLGTTTFAEDGNRQPDSIDRTAELKPEDRNGDYLKNVKALKGTETELNVLIFDTKVTKEMGDRYDSFNKTYEMRQAYSLNTYGDDVRYQQSNRDMADWAMKRLIQYHLETTVPKTFEAGAQRAVREAKDPADKSAAQAVVTLTQVQKALRNTTFRLSDDMKTQFHYDIPSGTAKMGMTSSLVNAGVEYRSRSTAQTVGNIDPGNDKINLNVNKKIDATGTSGEAKYGVLSETVNYGVSQKIAGPVSAQVGQSHGIRDQSRDETMFKLNFGTSF
jgi:hypothetical protein